MIRQRRDGPTHYATHGQEFVVDGSSNGGDGWAQGDVSRADEEDEVNGRVQLRKPECTAGPRGSPGPTECATDSCTATRHT